MVIIKVNFCQFTVNNVGCGYKLESSCLSPNYTMKLCFMKLKSCIKFDHVVRIKTLCHETFWSLMKHNFG